MALPADAINKYKVQYLRAVLDECDDVCRVIVPHLWEGYFTANYGHSPEHPGRLTDGQRKLRILGCVLNVPYNTNDATTEGDIVTAVQALIP